MKSSPYNWVISFSSPYMNYISRVLVTAHLKIYKGVDLSCKCCEEYVIFEFVCISQRPLDRHCPWCQSRKMLVQSRVLKPHWSLTSSLPSRKGKFQTHSPGGFQQQETKHMESTNPKYIWKLRVPKNPWKACFFKKTSWTLEKPSVPPSPLARPHCSKVDRQNAPGETSAPGTCEFLLDFWAEKNPSKTRPNFQ